MVVVVLEEEGSAWYPRDVEIPKAADLEYSAVSNVAGMVLLLNIEDYIFLAVYKARQHPVTLDVPIQVQGLLTRLIDKRMFG